MRVLVHVLVMKKGIVTKIGNKKRWGNGPRRRFDLPTCRGDFARRELAAGETTGTATGIAVSLPSGTCAFRRPSWTRK